MHGFAWVLGSIPIYNGLKKVIIEIKLWFWDCVRAVNHVFEIQNFRVRPPNCQSNHLSKCSKDFGFLVKKRSPVDPGGHGATALESKFPKFQSNWGLLSLL